MFIVSTFGWVNIFLGVTFRLWFFRTFPSLPTGVETVLFPGVDLWIYLFGFSSVWRIFPHIEWKRISSIGDSPWLFEPNIKILAFHFFLLFVTIGGRIHRSLFVLFGTCEFKSTSTLSRIDSKTNHKSTHFRYSNVAGVNGSHYWLFSVFWNCENVRINLIIFNFCQITWIND